MESVWSAETRLPQFKQFKGDKKTDVLIIGGGMAGILTAYILKNSGVDCILLEASEICSGATKNTTAKITAQHGLIYSKLISEFGTEKAELYFEANMAALKKYREMCQIIDCDFENKDNYVYSTNNHAKIEKELQALENIKAGAFYADDLPLPFKNATAVKFKNQAQFNPLKFIKEIAKDLPIFEHSAVQELIGTKAKTKKGTVTAERIIVATHFPFVNKHGNYFLKMYQHRSYVVALKNAADVNGMYVSENLKGNSFRNYGNLLLLGGGGHRTGKNGGNFEELRQLAAVNYPESEIKYEFAAQDCITLDGVPYIGKYSGSTDNMYVATGFNKWGMTGSMVAALLLKDLILNKDNPYAEVFCPSRTILRPQLAANGAEAVVNLLTPSKKRCPHLGCALKWNSAEHSWDCPCHGSRFTKEGELIDNPATGNIK